MDQIEVQGRALPIALRRSVLSLMLSGLFAGSASGFEVEGGGDVKMRWDTTLKYTAAWRMNSADGWVANQNGNQPNTDAGDLAYKKGAMINNRLDLLTEFDFSYHGFGFRVSGAAWDDEAFRDTNSYPAAPGTVPNYQGAFPGALLGGANNVNSQAAKNIMGRRAEVQDAFFFGKFDLGEQNLTVRAGRHSLVYGETLFLGMNGIAAAQGPIDAVKALSLPNVQYKEIGMPVGQVSADWSISPDLSIGGYVQYQWKATRIPSPGSYFSNADFVGAGGDLLATPFATLATRGDDFKGKNSGQWGMKVKFKVGDVDYGVYAARYDAKEPIVTINFPPIGGGLGGGTYNVLYARNIDVFGASFSTVFGETNIAGEISTRRNTPLAVPGDMTFNVNPAMDNDKNTPYARGNSLHLNLSAITLFGGNGFWGGASLVGEFAFNRLLDVTYTPSTVGLPPGFPYTPLNQTHTKDASAIRVVFTPSFFQVMPGVDLEVPIGVGYGLSGRSAVVAISPEHGGDFSIGLNADVDKTWKAGLSYTHYFGEKGTAPSATTATWPFSASYKQSYADRDFVSFTIQRTF